MEALAKKILHKPVEITVGGRSIVCKDVTQEIVMVDDEHKFLKLLEVGGSGQTHGQISRYQVKFDNISL